MDIMDKISRIRLSLPDVGIDIGIDNRSRRDTIYLIVPHMITDPFFIYITTRTTSS